MKILEFYKKNRLKFTLLLIVINLALLALNFPLAKKETFPETEELLSYGADFRELETFFKGVAERKGPVYAFDLLKVAPIPPDTDVHLLAHAIGNILYKEEGFEGIKFCTEDFRNACSHSIVVGAFIEKGVDAITDIGEVCRRAPGGSGAYAMCFHGLGHGVLAAQDYDLGNAASLCRRVGTSEFNYIESAECVGGVIMESIEGVHDRDAWERQRATYFRDDDPLYPCNQGHIIPSNGRDACFSYLTPHLWQVAGADLGDPTEEDFEKSFQYCSLLTGELDKHKEACYGGFGKEFVGLVKARDIRNVAEITDEQLGTIYKWCLLAKDPIGIGSCIRDALNSLYWGGENKPDAALSLCGIIREEELKTMCFEHLAGIFNYYISGNNIQLKLLCNRLPEGFRKQCYDPNKY